MTNEEKCFKFSVGSVSEVLVLACTHEEADRYILLYAKHASITYRSTIINLEDTSIFILCLDFNSEIDFAMLIKKGTASCIHNFDVEALGHDTCVLHYLDSIATHTTVSVRLKIK